MSITVVKTLRRPATSVAFQPSMSLTQKTHIHENYVLTGKLIFKHVDVSPDGLTKTITRIFANQEDYDQYKADTIIETYRDDSNLHNTTNNITGTVQVVA